MRQSGARVALALIDVELPGSGGHQVSRLLQSLDQVPVLFMSGYDRDSLVAEGRLDSSAEMLSKPFSVSKLLGAVHQRLDAIRH